MLMIFTQTFAVRAVKSTANQVPLPLEEMKWDPEEDSMPLADTGISDEAELDVIRKTFDEEIREFMTNQDVQGLIAELSPNPTLSSLSRLNSVWNEACKKEMDRRLAERSGRAQLVDELESFGTKYSRDLDPDSIWKMSATEEINHYLNGFEFRMYGWMALFHRNPDGAMKQQIEEFASKLAQHRATYPRPPPHRRGNQEKMSKFDDFIKMRDNIMEILQDRIRKDHIMFHYDYSTNPSSLFLERSAMIQMMKIMETIGIVIDYPGVREMQKEANFGSKYDVLQMQKLLEGTVEITEWHYNLTRRRSDGTKRVEQELSRESCIGRQATSVIMVNVKVFVWFLKQESVGNVEVSEHENGVREVPRCQCSVQ